MPVAAVAASQRERLYGRFEAKIRPSPDLARALVSDQGNRKARVHGRLRYREAFSADLARRMIEQYSPAGGVVLDPFAGVGTTAFAASALDRPSIAIELLPVGAAAIEARLAAGSADPALFARHLRATAGARWADLYEPRFAFPHIPITQGAFSAATERALSGFRAYCRRRIRDRQIRTLFEFACLAVLEDVSFTRKDGQYLRWDARAPRERKGARFNKGRILEFDAAIRDRLEAIGRSIAGESAGAGIDLRVGSCLELLPAMPEASIDLVLTSPPYCNRYDYTRTYALELAWLGLGDAEVKTLRQMMLSCTVENRDKAARMEALYDGRGRAGDCRRVRRVFDAQAALHEVLGILEEQARSGRLNNPNIPRLVRNYFFEMCFVVFELARLLRPGGRVVMVNDNVRYAGEEVPVDLILCDFARRFGLRTERIWTLARGKGNSSQQMGAHGRAELRKCVYVWRKP